MEDAAGPIRVSEGGVYRCRAGRGDPLYYTDYSDDLTLNTTDGESFCNLHRIPIKQNTFHWADHHLQ